MTGLESGERASARLGPLAVIDWALTADDRDALAAFLYSDVLTRTKQGIGEIRLAERHTDRSGRACVKFSRPW